MQKNITLNSMAHLLALPLIPNLSRVPTENRLLWVDFVEIIWVTILSRQAAEQARLVGEAAELEADGGGPVTAEFGVSKDAILAFEGEVVLETDHSNGDKVNGSIPSEGGDGGVGTL